MAQTHFQEYPLNMLLWAAAEAVVKSVAVAVVQEDTDLMLQENFRATIAVQSQRYS
jgi:hypothetical protein